MNRKVCGTLLVLACAAWGQSTDQTVTQVFHFTNAQGAVSMQEITNAVRTVPEITHATFDMGGKTLTVTATTAQMDMATWIFSTFDAPAPSSMATQEYAPPGSTNDFLRIMYLTHGQGPQSQQEIINAVRTIPEMTKVFPFVSQQAIVIRGNANQVAMSEWLFHQLDLPVGMQPAQQLTAHQYATAGVNNDQIQMLSLGHEWTPQNMQEIVNAVRTVPQLSKVFPCTTTGTIAVRGAPATVALATWIFGQLDRTQAPAEPSEYQMPGGADDVTQIYYMGPATSSASLQNAVNAVRPAMSIPVFPNFALKAVILRGKATQIAAADSLLKQLGNP